MLERATDGLRDLIELRRERHRFVVTHQQIQQSKHQPGHTHHAEGGFPAPLGGDHAAQHLRLAAYELRRHEVAHRVVLGVHDHVGLPACGVHDLVEVARLPV